MMPRPQALPSGATPRTHEQAQVDWPCLRLLVGVAVVVVAAGYAGQAPWSAHLLAYVWRAL